MFRRIASILGWLRRLAASRSSLLIENLALRQQLAILTAKRPRPRMRAADRFFWVALRRFWPRWKEALIVIQPDTVVRWHRQGFKKYWTWKSRRRLIGRPSTKAKIRRLVRRMAAENPTWGAPRVHGELLMLGFDVSERTVSRMMPRRPADPEARQRWRNFLCNHREVLAAMDFFTVPTATFRVLYVFFVIHHARRTVLHVRVTEHPTAAWIIQQLREAFAYDAAPRHLIFDNDKKYGANVLAVIEHLGIRRKQITPYSPWQNGAAERWVATVRRDLLDHVIVLNERHLHRLLSEFVAYYHDDRTHLGLGKNTPSMRVVASKPNGDAEIVGHPRLGGLHHRYEWRQAA
jgi:transposase InsO family protein